MCEINYRSLLNLYPFATVKEYYYNGKLINEYHAENVGALFIKGKLWFFKVLVDGHWWYLNKKEIYNFLINGFVDKNLLTYPHVGYSQP